MEIEVKKGINMPIVTISNIWIRSRFLLIGQAVNM